MPTSSDQPKTTPTTASVPPKHTTPDHGEDATLWTIHEERLVDDTRKLRLSVASVELPDGVKFEQWVLRMPKAAMTVVLNDAGDHVLMIWRHRWIMNQWTYELPGGYVDPAEDTEQAAAREVEEETGWRPRSITYLSRFQPLTGSADFENLLYISEGAEDTGASADINEAARVEWVPLAEVPRLIADNKIIGAAAQVALWQVLATRVSR
ncbi:NUDIX hydrolase [Kutzneria kofuensis]|uniref:8-oxo-dGTP pyrophosphatase MutT (NUDIX family) n=1 Tax=Kutzneria kofuensis TaxID=103725 RepID=A0A7W9KDR5_9PSEU|nr:NUDIX hydrolase [Kutzneria kofuensis]MBB5890622.1 8-oxo-dGTP pyrophosphatase MutT (NUDIX family) [Kutzneria kofuensis]